jgi:hypothetical protein
MMHIYLRTTAAAFNAGVRRVAAEQRLWTFSASFPAEVPGYRVVELYCGDATLALPVEEIAEVFRAFY